MLQFYLWLGSRLRPSRAWRRGTDPARPMVPWLTRLGRHEDGQTTAEYALVLLAAAAVAFVLIAWAESTDKLPAFFDMIIDSITGEVE